MTEEGTVDSLFDQLESYGKTNVDLFKLKAIDKSTDVLSSIIPAFAIAVLYVISLLLLSTGASLWLGKLLGDYYYGFFIVGIIYGIAGWIIYQFRFDAIKKYAGNFIVKQIFK